MIWTEVFENNKNIIELRDDVLGTVGYLTTVREVGKSTTWEVEFSVGALELYMNEIFVGDLEGAKDHLLTAATNYLQSKVKEFTDLQFRVSEMTNTVKKTV